MSDRWNAKWHKHIKDVHGKYFIGELGIVIEYYEGFEIKHYHMHRVDRSDWAYQRIMATEKLTNFNGWLSHTDLIQAIKDHAIHAMNIEKLIEKI